MPPSNRPRLQLPLAERVLDRGFTPSARDLDALIDLLADDDIAKDVERAIHRVGPAAVGVLSVRFPGARPPLRARVVRAIGRFVDDEQALAVLLAALEDADPKTRRNAVIALGHARAEALRPEVERALLAVWDADPRPEMRRSVAAALGKTGTAAVLPILQSAAAGEDDELARIARLASAMVERTETRGDREPIDGARSPQEPLEVLVGVRHGIEEILAEELSHVEAVTDVRVAGVGLVRARLRGALNELFAARTMLSVRFPLPSQGTADGNGDGDGDGVPGGIARAMESDVARAVFAAWTLGPARYRIRWASGGHKRAATWTAAQEIARRTPNLVNDPTASSWEILVAVRNQRVEVAISPRALDDPRFTWRRGDVPAASHPTIAAALARVAGVRDDDVVWDPFVGSGSELIERARLGPYRALIGTDTDPRALAVARENTAAAGVTARLERADAMAYSPPGVTLVITNPPMGRRASRNSGLDNMLDHFVERAAGLLAPGGRLVWIAPWAERARAAGAGAGLTLDWARSVDMGGFDAELQRWTKPLR